MKRIFAFILVLMMAFALCACRSVRDLDLEDEKASKETVAEAEDNEDDRDEETQDGGDDQQDSVQKPVKDLPDYIGKWEYEYKIADTVAETFTRVYGDQFRAPTCSMDVFMEISFLADGTYSLEYILNEDAIHNYCTELAHSLEDALYAQYSAMGVDRTQTEEMIEKLFGMSVEAYCLQAAESAVSYESLYNRFVTRNAYGYHKLEEGKIYVTPEKNDWDHIYGYYVYSVEGFELIIEDMYMAETGQMYSEDTLSQSFGSLQLPWVMNRK